jgi:hypothetical protein
LIRATIGEVDSKLLFETADSRKSEDETNSRVEEGSWIKNGILWREMGVELDTKGCNDQSLHVFKSLQRYNPAIVETSIMEAAAVSGDLYSIKSLFALGKPD